MRSRDTHSRQAGESERNRWGSSRDFALVALEAASAGGARPVAYSDVVEALRHVPGGRSGNAPADDSWRKATATRGLASVLADRPRIAVHEGGSYRLLREDYAYNFWHVGTLLEACRSIAAVAASNGGKIDPRAAAQVPRLLMDLQADLSGILGGMRTIVEASSKPMRPSAALGEFVPRADPAPRPRSLQPSPPASQTGRRTRKGSSS